MSFFSRAVSSKGQFLFTLTPSPSMVIIALWFMFIRAHGLSYRNDKNIVQTDCFVDIKTLFLKVCAWMDSVGGSKKV